MTSNGSQYNIHFDNTEDQTWFKDGRINGYDALIFLDNTGEGAYLRIRRSVNSYRVLMHIAVLDNDAQSAFQNYIDAGGNFVGIHSASDCLRNSTFYANELGKLRFCLSINFLVYSTADSRVVKAHTSTTIQRSRTR